MLKSHHHLLVALLLCNAAANEALPIFLDKIVDEKMVRRSHHAGSCATARACHLALRRLVPRRRADCLHSGMHPAAVIGAAVSGASVSGATVALAVCAQAILISVSCVLVFGEILPSAVMTGPAQLQIAAALAPAIKVLLLLTSPISYPMAKLLDAWLGHQDGMTRFKRNEFKALIKVRARRVRRRAPPCEAWPCEAWPCEAWPCEAWAPRSQPRPLLSSRLHCSPLGAQLQHRTKGWRRRSAASADAKGGAPMLSSSRERQTSTGSMDMSPPQPTPPPSKIWEISQRLAKGSPTMHHRRRPVPVRFGSTLSKAPAHKAPADEAIAEEANDATRAERTSAEFPLGETEFSDDEVTILMAVFGLQSKHVGARLACRSVPRAPRSVRGTHCARHALCATRIVRDTCRA